MVPPGCTGRNRRAPGALSAETRRPERPFVVFHPEFPVGNVGGVVLRSFVLTFDQRNKPLRLEAPERTLVLPRPRPRTAPPVADGGVPQPGR